MFQSASFRTASFRTAPRRFRLLAQRAFVIIVLAACQPLVQQFSTSSTTAVAVPAGLSFATNPAIYHQSVAIPPNVLTQTGGAATFTVAPSLPPGLVLDTQTGTISGTPQTASQQTSYTVTATNASGKATVVLALAVSDPPPLLTFPAGSYSFVIGRSTQTVLPINSGGPIISCAAQTALPAGLQIDSKTCAIFGTPTAISAGAAVTIVANYDGGTVSTQVTLAVVGVLSLFPPSVTMRGLPGDSFTFTPVGGVGPFLYSVISGDGSISSSGVFSPANVRSDTVIQVTDANGDSSTASIKTLLPLVDDIVSAFAGNGSEFYLGGSFLHVNPEPAAAVVALDESKGTPLLAFDTQQSFDGAATAAVADSTGIYVVGAFVNYRGHIVNGIVKLDPNTGAVDTVFNSAGGFDGLPITMAADANSLYVAGNFSGYAGAAASELVKIDKTTGAADQTFVGSLTGDCSHCGLVVHDNLLFVVPFSGGSMGTDHFLPLSSTTGAYVNSFGLHGAQPFGLMTTDSVGLFIVDNGYLVKVDLTTGQAVPGYTPVPVVDGNVTALLADNGVLYVAVLGATPGTTTIQRYNGNSGAAMSGFATVFSGGPVHTMTALSDGIAVGGEFTAVGGTTVGHIAKISTSTGALVAGFTTTGIGGHFANSPFGVPSGTSVASIVSTSQGLFLAGNLTSVGGTTEPYLAKFSGVTFATETGFTPPTPDAQVTALALSGNDLYVGGSFNHLAGNCVAGIGKLNAGTGSKETFGSILGPAGCSSTVSVSALVADAGEVGVAGGFSSLQVNGSNVAAASGVAILDPTGALTATFSLADPAVSLALPIAVFPSTEPSNCIFIGTSNSIAIETWDPASGSCFATAEETGLGNVTGIVQIGTGQLVFAAGSGVYLTSPSDITATTPTSPTIIADADQAFNTIVSSQSGDLILGGPMQSFADLGGSALIEGLVEMDADGGSAPTNLGRVTGAGIGTVDVVAPLFGQVFVGGDFYTRAGTIAPFAAFLDEKSGQVIR